MSDRPALRIVRGKPTDPELAALTVALAAVRRRRADGSAEPPHPDPSPGGWSDPAARLRHPLHPGPGAWARSALPH